MNKAKKTVIAMIVFYFFMGIAIGFVAGNLVIISTILSSLNKVDNIVIDINESELMNTVYSVTNLSGLVIYETGFTSTDELTVQTISIADTRIKANTDYILQIVEVPK